MGQQKSSSRGVAVTAGGLPERIGKYQVRRLLGSGGMGRVYLAVDPDIGREVAIKQVTLSADPQARERFVREAQTMGRLNHPNITTLLEFSADAAAPFLVLELLTGEDLTQWLCRPHSLREQLQVMLDVAQAIAAAHQAGVMHRDLKPDNVRVLENGHCKLLDFGIAQSGAGQLTAAGFFVGTPEYVAPEVMSGSAHTPASDLYALGLLYYVLLTGENPFRGDTVQATVARVIQRISPPLGTRVLGVPPAISDLVARCLSKHPEDRPQSASEIVGVVEQCLAQTPADARLREAPQRAETAPQGTPLTPSPTRNTRAAATASPAPRRGWIVAAVLAIAAAAGWVWQWQAPPVQPTVVTAPVPRVQTPPATTSAKAPEGAPAGTTAAPSEPPVSATGISADLPGTQEPATQAPEPASRKPEPAPTRSPPSVTKPPDEPISKPAATVQLPPASVSAPATSAPPAAVPAEPPIANPVEPAPTPAPEIAPLTPSVAVSVSRYTPEVLKAGRSATLRIEGSGLDAVTSAQVTIGGNPDTRFRIGDLRHPDSGSLTFSIAVARGVPLGSYALILGGPGVHSKPLILEVTI